MRLRVKDIIDLGNKVVTVRPSTTLEELNKLLVLNKISGVPVVDESDRVIGVVSQSDIVKLLREDLSTPPGFYHCPLTPFEKVVNVARDFCDRNVSSIMERRVHSVSIEDDVTTAARMMRNLHVHRLIVQRNGTLVGIITALDLLKVVETPKAFLEFYDRTTTA